MQNMVIFPASCDHCMQIISFRAANYDATIDWYRVKSWHLAKRLPKAFFSGLLATDQIQEATKSYHIINAR